MIRKRIIFPDRIAGLKRNGLREALLQFYPGI